MRWTETSATAWKACSRRCCRSAAEAGAALGRPSRALQRPAVSTAPAAGQGPRRAAFFPPGTAVASLSVSGKVLPAPAARVLRFAGLCHSTPKAASCAPGSPPSPQGAMGQACNITPENMRHWPAALAPERGAASQRCGLRPHILRYVKCLPAATSAAVRPLRGSSCLAAAPPAPAQPACLLRPRCKAAVRLFRQRARSPAPIRPPRGLPPADAKATAAERGRKACAAGLLRMAPCSACPGRCKSLRDPGHACDSARGKSGQQPPLRVLGEPEKSHA